MPRGGEKGMPRGGEKGAHTCPRSDVWVLYVNGSFMRRTPARRMYSICVTDSPSLHARP